jgi:DNA-binding MarR family transcriptional regulator
MNIETGVLLLSKEALVAAINDMRLSRQHLRILAQIIRHMNRSTAKAWPSRHTIAAELNLAPETVTNRLRELKQFGYLISEREPVPQANNRRLMVYTLAGIDHETLRREIETYIERIRAPEEVTARSDIAKPLWAVTFEPNVTAGSDFEGTENGAATQKVTTGSGAKSLPVVDSNSLDGTQKNITTVAQVERGCGGESSPSARPTVGPTVDVEFKDIDSSASFQTPPEIDAAKLKPASKTKASASHDVTRGTRLPDEWWPTNDEFHRIVDVWDLTPNQALHIVREFKNYWLSVPGKAGRKTDWKRTLVNRLDTKATRRGEEPAGQTNRTSSAGSRKPSVNDIADDVFSYQD